MDGNDAIIATARVGYINILQFHELVDRLLKQFMEKTRSAVAEDHAGNPVYLARNAWHLNKGQDDWPGIRFLKTKEEAA